MQSTSELLKNEGSAEIPSLTSKPDGDSLKENLTQTMNIYSIKVLLPVKLQIINISFSTNNNNILRIKLLTHSFPMHSFLMPWKH